MHFDPPWGGLEEIAFQALHDWTEHPLKGIRYYSGIAVNKKIFKVPFDKTDKFWLDLGSVRHLASVTLNGRKLGVVWTAP